MKKTLIYTTLFIGLGLILGLLAVQPSLAQESEMQIANSLYENGRFAIVDLQSSNGTFVNGQRITPHTPYPLPGGMVRVELGKFTSLELRLQ